LSSEGPIIITGYTLVSTFQEQQMYIVDFHPSRKAPAPKLFIVPSALEQSAEDQDRDDGKYRSARDYPLSAYSYLDYAEVENNAHNAANYDAAEALDMN
jgi:hypothetical protein